jgi:hypothetical protein
MDQALTVMSTSPNGDDERCPAVLTLRCGLVADATNPQGCAVHCLGGPFHVTMDLPLKAVGFRRYQEHP